MLPNKPSKTSQIPNGPFNSPEVPATFDRLFGARVANEQLDPNPTPEEPEPWKRPEGWLPLPTITSTDEKFAGLFPIYNVDSNFLAFTFEGDYRVDWGDGSVELYSSGVKAQHSYDFRKIPSNTETPEGFRQVVVTVVPQGGSHLTYVNLAKRHDNQIVHLVAPPIDIPWLDIAISMPNANTGSSIRVSDDYAGLYSQLQQFSLLNSGNCQYLDYLLASSYNLRSFILDEASNLENLSSSLEYCYSIQEVSLSGLTSLYELNEMFYNCNQLKVVELHDLNSAMGFYGTFDYCSSLKSVRITGLTSANSASISDLVTSYNSLDTPESLCLEDLTSLESASPFSFYPSNLKGKLKLTGLTGLTTINGCFQEHGLSSIHLYGLDNVTDAADAFDYCNSLEDVVMDGTQNIEVWDYCFYDCYSLKNAPNLDTSSATSMYYMFVVCLSLAEVPLYDTSKVEDMGNMFDECASLQQIPNFNTSSCENFSYSLAGCQSLAEAPAFDLSSATDISGMFNGCFALKSVPAFDVSSVSDFGGTFANTNQLAKAALQGTSTDISYSNCCLSRSAILDIFNGLATVSGADIDVSYNYGAASLTAEDIAIAEDRGWTVTY